MVVYGGAAALGFAAGTIISLLNYRWISRLTTLEKPVTPRTAMLLGGRYLIFGALGYVIFKYSETGFMAALAGCFVHMAAVFIEVIYELTYAGTP